MKHILVIEDDLNIAELQRDYLQMSGYKVDIVQEGKLGLQRAVSGEYDLIIVDLMLPGMDGYEIIKMIREKREIPLIIVSARSEDIDKIRGLGVGCGIGLNTILLAKAIGPLGRIVGLDSEEDMLLKAQSLVNGTKLEGSITLEKDDARKLAYPERCFDWACSFDCVGALDFDPVILLKELNRVVKPGGRVFIILWSSQMLLPGYPLLEARLNATSAGLAPFKIGMMPNRHIMRAPEWFRQAGFTDVQARTLIRDVSAPLSSEIIAALTDLYAMRWGSIEGEVSPEVWQDYQRLCHPASPEFILKVPDYYAFFTYTVFYGRVQ